MHEFLYYKAKSSVKFQDRRKNIQKLRDRIQWLFFDKKIQNIGKLQINNILQDQKISDVPVQKDSPIAINSIITVIFFVAIVCIFIK